MQTVATAGGFPPTSAGNAASPGTSWRHFPQKLQRTRRSCSGTAVICARAVLAAAPELITLLAKPTHSSQMQAPGPAITLPTSAGCLPQKVQVGGGLARISLGLGEQLVVHLSTVTRRLTPANGPAAWAQAVGQPAWPVSKRLTLPFVIVKAHRVRISPQVSLR